MRARNEGRLIAGTGPAVVARLRSLANSYGTDEVLINLLMPGAAARMRALDAICAALDGIPAASSPAAAEETGEPT